MSNKYKITEEHKIELEKIKQKYINNAMRTDAMTDHDKDQMRVAMRGLYKNANLPYPGDDKIIFVSSPLVAQFAAGIAMALNHGKSKHYYSAEAAARVAIDAETAAEDAAMAAETAAEDAARVAVSDADAAVRVAASDAARVAADAAIDATRAAARAAVRVAASDADAAIDATRAAVRVAAEDDARVAARVAARAAARVAAARVAARDADAAVRVAAEDDARVAVSDAARDAEDATRVAVRDAASDAARDAEIAAIDAARDATFKNSLDIFLSAFVNVTSKYGKFALYSCGEAWRYRTRSALWPWYQVYGDFFKNIAKLKGDWEKWDSLNLDCLHGGVRFMTQDFTIISDRPEAMKMDDIGRLHCENDAAIRWRDGMRQYYWHGVAIPDYWITHKSALTPEIALKWVNVEQRRCACEILGWENILQKLSAVTIDKDQDPQIGELVEVEIPEIGKEKFLRVVCGTGRKFALPVPPEINTALDAQCWINFCTPEDILSIEFRT